MENFVVSARKYRPATFDTVVGQHSITTTLKNAIKNHHLAQAFLFCGPRGVGKTTCARILAKTINCFNITDNIEACDECESCKSFNSGQSLNVYELDAASNNSVDDIRNLIDQVRFAPQLGSHKVYIIDEVHMLSQQAFNAFLKTLEEPPKHAIFILATTEKHKIIPTILSRCQVFDFNRIKVEDIANHLSNIAQKEGIDADKEALHIIAQKADGALRDALSIFDQIVSFSGNKISYQDVIDNLNILDYDYYFKFCDFIFEQQTAQILLLFNEILSKGFDGHQFINGLAEHFRNILVCKDPASIELLEVSNNIKEKYTAYAEKFEGHELIDMLQILSNADAKYKSSKNQRLLVEITLLQLASVLSEAEKKKPVTEIPPLILTHQVNTKNNKQEIKKEEKVTPSLPTASTPSNHSNTTTKNVVNEKQDKYRNLNINKLNVVTDTIKIKAANSSTNKENKEVKESLYTPPKEEKIFTEEDFIKVWKMYQKILEQDGKDSLAMVYDTIPEFNESYTFTIPIHNKALEDEFKEDKPNLLEFLRKKLHNYSINILTYVVKEESQKKAYTPEEKFKKIVEKNPSVGKLAQKLKLIPKH